MLTIGESRAISHENVTQQQAQQVAVHPHRWAWNRHEPHALVWANSRLFTEECYRWEKCRKTFKRYWPPNRKSTNWTVLQIVLTCPYSFIPFPFIKLSPNIQSFKFKIPALPVRASLHGHTDHQSPGDGAVIHTMLLSTEFRSRVTYDQARAAIEAGREKCYWNICLLKINISNYFIGKRPKKSFLLLSFFIFSLHSPRPTLIRYSRSSPHHNQSLYNMFHDARFLIKVDLYFPNRMPDYFGRARGAYMSLACRKLRCFCCVRILGLLAGYWAT